MSRLLNSIFKISVILLLAFIASKLVDIEKHLNDINYNIDGIYTIMPEDK